MRSDLAAADRHAAVRRAAWKWHSAGVIDAAARIRIGELYPDDRVRVGLAIRVLLQVFTVVAGFGAFGVLMAGAHDLGTALIVGVGAAAATELLVTHSRRRGGGIEEGTAFLTLVMLTLGIASLGTGRYHAFAGALLLALLAASLVCAGIVWRWGMPSYAGIGAAALYLLLAQSRLGAALWFIIPVAVVPFLLRGARSASFGPAYRNASSWALAVSLAALYIAVNLAAADRRWIAGLNANYSSWASDSGIAPWLRTLHVVATALLPLLVLALSLHRRERLLLWCGALMAAASLLTLRHYVHLAPLWLELIAAGLAAIATALVVRRRLDAAPGRERAGFTAEPLDSESNRARLVELAATLAAFTPQAQPSEPKPGVEAGGGEFGGGGASDSF